MSEYIVKESPTTYETDILGVKHGVTSYRRCEEIVRCRDCRMFGDCEWNYENEPMGFCSWGYVLNEGGDD